MKLFVAMQLLAVLPYIFVGYAHAYIDPGTGSMIIQAVIAAVVAVSVSIGISWHRLRGFLGRLFGHGRNGSDGSDGD